MAESRRPLRSTTGCARCRKRRKKCDDVKPSCGPCRRLGLCCPFLDSVPNVKDRTDLLRLDTDISMTSESQIVAKIGTSTIYLNPCPDHGVEMCAVLQHFGENRHRFMQTPDQRPSMDLIGLLPTASGYPMVLAALSATLSLFMPLDWIQKTSFSLRLYHQAVVQLSTSLAAGDPSAPSDQAMLTAGLLYLFDVGSPGK